jgi:hypothetical protein
VGPAPRCGAASRRRGARRGRAPPLFRLAKHSAPVTALLVIGDLGQIASCSEAGELIFWDYVAQGVARLVQHEQAMLCLALRGGAREVLVGTRSGAILRFPLHPRPAQALVG